MRTTRNIIFIVFVLSISFAQDSFEKYRNLSLNELLNINIVSASNTSEKIKNAPAYVIVVSSDEIKERGYTDLVELFNDLPGIDLAVTYGDLYYKTYWRGFRKGMGSPFILMIDGMNMNHLWFNWTDILVAFPLSNIERIEIVYGPASSVYGPNAMMGVVNVITYKDKLKDGASINSQISVGSFDTKVADLNLFYKKDDFRVSLTGFINNGELDKKSAENYEYTKSRYVSDPKLWGGFLDNDNIAGNVSSPRKIRSFSLNLFLGDVEVGAQYFKVGDGWGLNYAFDKVQPVSVWIEEDYNFYIRNQYKLGKKVTGKTLFRYRKSDLPNSSTSLEGRGDYGEERKIAFGYWQSLNSSLSFQQDFEFDLLKQLTLITGLKYEQKDLQKAYDLNYTDEFLPEEINLINFDFPASPVPSLRNENRVTWIDQGIYVQSKYNFKEILDSESDHYLNFGIRYDDNSAYGDNINLRVGYVGNINSFNFKLLYGEAIQEPTPRELHGAWSGVGNTPDLISEKSRTLESVINYTSKDFSFTLNPYKVNIDNTIANINGKLTNLGERDIYGFDIHSHYSSKLSSYSKVKLWMFYTFTTTDEQKFDDEGIKTGTGIIGDIATSKFQFGSTFSFKSLVTTLRGRFIGERETFDNNPIDKVDSFLTVDFTLLYKNLLIDGIDLSLKINNLFDKKYFHPGIRDASAGEISGYWNNNRWYGSRGWSSSLLPQPGRSIILSISISN